MERKRTLNRIFIKYLLLWVGGSLLTAAVNFILPSIAMNSGLLYPANYAEKLIKEQKTALQTADVITPDRIPILCEYALYEKNGAWKEGTIPQKQGGKAWEVSHQSFPGSGSDFYQLIERKQEILVLRYHITVQFVNPLLRKLFPWVEMAWIIVTLLEILILLVFVGIRFGHMLSRKMEGLQESITKIEAQDLEFHLPGTGVREIDRISDSIEKMKEALKKSLATQWGLEKQRQEQIGALAHDLKTPITIIRGYQELLAEGALPPDQEECVLAIGNGIDQIQEVVERLLEVSRGEDAEAMKLDFIETSSFTHSLQEQLQGMALEHRSVLIWNQQELPPLLYADASGLRRCILNIASNAFSYAGTDGKVEVTLKLHSEFLNITVEDSGPGFSGEALEKGTQEFYTGHTARTRGSHLGLGLYMAQKTAAVHGGSLSLARSSKLAGAKVIIQIPYGKDTFKSP